ncbi:keratin-associated protein 12-2-like [Bos mutus]|uniref:keratin-associated protein 12-2-like n=1 Tax=Bos mutus TaxID=72004 RepID=UPI0038B4A33B
MCHTSFSSGCQAACVPSPCQPSCFTSSPCQAACVPSPCQPSCFTSSPCQAACVPSPCQPSCLPVSCRPAVCVTPSCRSAVRLPSSGCYQPSRPTLVCRPVSCSTPCCFPPCLRKQNRFSAFRLVWALLSRPLVELTAPLSSCGLWRPPGQGSSREWPSIPWLMTKGMVVLGRPRRLQAGL